MKEVFEIVGEKPLKGKVIISGSKNATVALLPATVLAQQPIRISGIPQIADIAALSNLLQELNCHIEVLSNDEIIINPINIINIPLDHHSVTKLRASYYFMGALLGRFKEVAIRMSGGCDLGPRPIDLHIKGFKALGANVEFCDGIYRLWAKELIGNKIYLDIASVGATINIMMAAVYAKGRTIIENAAREPEIIDVANMLNSMGAKIRGVGTSIITIDGVDYLGACYHEIIPDRIEAGTYIILGATATKELLIENVIPYHLESLLSKLKEMNILIETGSDWVKVRRNGKIIATDLLTRPYPGLATDLQQPFSVLLTQAAGMSQITETIYEERFKHCAELRKMGADIKVKEGRCLIKGPSPLVGCEVIATDLRCGAAMVIAALVAKGKTTIQEIYHIDRGYAGIDEKLRNIGADILRKQIN